MLGCAQAAADDPNDHISQWIICAGGRNYGKYCDQKVEDLFKRQAGELDFEKRKKIYKEMEEYLLDQAPLMNYWSKSYAMSRAYLRGWLPMGGNHTNMLYETAWLDK